MIERVFPPGAFCGPESFSTSCENQLGWAQTYILFDLSVSTHTHSYFYMRHQGFVVLQPENIGSGRHGSDEHLLSILSSSIHSCPFPLILLQLSSRASWSNTLICTSPQTAGEADLSAWFHRAHPGNSKHKCTNQAHSEVWPEEFVIADCTLLNTLCYIEEVILIVK